MNHSKEKKTTDFLDWSKNHGTLGKAVHSKATEVLQTEFGKDHVCKIPPE